LVAVALALVCVVASPARAAEAPPLTIPYADAADAALIIEGRIVANDRVALERTYYSASPLAENEREITVRGLARHERDLAPSDGGSGLEIGSVRVLLLLEKGDGAAEWRPLRPRLARTPAGAAGTHPLTPDGAAGTYWIVGDRVWCYGPTPRGPGQEQGPGRELGRWPGTADRLRTDVALGVAARLAWEQDLAVADPAERARRLLRWLLPSSPDGTKYSRRRRAAPEEILRLGAPAVPALAAALGEKEGDKEFHREVLTVLGRLGPAARAAVPRLLEFAPSPAGTAVRESVAYALAGTGDPRSLSALRAILAEAPLSSGVTFQYATNGLAYLRDPELADRIAARLPDSLEGMAQSKESNVPVSAVYGILFLLEALKALDPGRMRAWLEPRADDPLFTGGGNQPNATTRKQVAELLRTEGRSTK
jgi:hypothetical protein